MRAGNAAVREFAPAKINLALHVVGRRADGYHLLDSLVAFADVGDVVTASPAGALSLAISGPMSAGLAGDENLVTRAARALAAAAGRAAPNATLHLDKRLPVAAGIGGGSSDAAAALRALDRLWELGFGPARLAEIGAGLGADIPVCVHARPTRMRGVGEVLDPLSLPPVPTLLVNPGVGVSTAAVFGRLERRDNPGLPDIPDVAAPEALTRYLGQCRNDLQPPAMAAEPSIARVLEALAGTPGCLIARMSGSGATCFGLYATSEAAAAAGRLLADRHPRWWVAAATLR